METLCWNQRQEEREISRAGRDRHTDTELGILLMPDRHLRGRRNKDIRNLRLACFT